MIDCIQNRLFAELMTNWLCWQMENFRASKNAQGNMIKMLKRLSNWVIFELFVSLQQTKFLNTVLLFRLVLSTVNSYSSKSSNRKRKGRNKAGDLLFVIWLRCVEKEKLCFLPGLWEKKNLNETIYGWSWFMCPEYLRTNNKKDKFRAGQYM